MTEDDSLRWLVGILERRQRHYDARMRDREGAATLAAIANLPIGWLFEDPRRERDDLILRATGPEGDEIEVARLPRWVPARRTVLGAGREQQGRGEDHQPDVDDSTTVRRPPPCSQRLRSAGAHRTRRSAPITSLPAHQSRGVNGP